MPKENKNSKQDRENFLDDDSSSDDNLDELFPGGNYYSNHSFGVFIWLRNLIFLESIEDWDNDPVAIYSEKQKMKISDDLPEAEVSQMNSFFLC